MDSIHCIIMNHQVPFSPLVPGKARFINCDERNLIIFLQIYRTVVYLSHRIEAKIRELYCMSSLNCAHNTSLQMRCAVVCLPDLCADFISGCGAGAGELCSGQGQERGCDAQFHFSRTLPPPPSPQPPAPSPAASCRAAARYLH